MAKIWATPFYNSAAWRKCRAAYVSSVNGLCEKCLDKGKTTPGVEVHHKVELNPENINDPYITLSWSNLQLLCFTCHQDITHNRTSPLREGLAFNERGELINVE